MGKRYQVMVSGVRGGKVTVDLSNTEEQFKSMTVEQLREKIRQTFPETPDEINLVFGSEILMDSFRLTEYGIHHMSIVQVVIKLRGGGDIKEDHEQDGEEDSEEKGIKPVPSGKKDGDTGEKNPKKCSMENLANF